MEEGLPLLGVEADEDVDELLEGRRVARVAQLGLSEPHHVVPGEGRAAVAAEHRAHLEFRYCDQVVPVTSLKVVTRYKKSITGWYWWSYRWLG